MERREWIGLFGRTAPAALRVAAAPLGKMRDPAWLRRPETGSVMVRGRAGGTGAAFNLGEVTATRCALRDGDLEGHAVVQGRDADHATLAAWLDLLLQGPRAAEVRRTVLIPLAQAEAARRDARARKAEATRVDFETMARGED